jgi:hypothetical protein
MLKDFLSQSHLLKRNLMCAKHLIREYKTEKWNFLKLKYDAENNGCPISSLSLYLQCIYDQWFSAWVNLCQIVVTTI